MAFLKSSIQKKRFSTALIRNAERWQRNIVRDVTDGVTPIEVVSKSKFKEWKSKQPQEVSSWLKATGYIRKKKKQNKKNKAISNVYVYHVYIIYIYIGNTNPKPYSHIFLQDNESVSSNQVKVLYIANDDKAIDGDDGGLLSPYAFSNLASNLPTGKYMFNNIEFDDEIKLRSELSWSLGSYKYQRYNAKKYEKILNDKKLPIGAVLVSSIPSLTENLVDKEKIDKDVSDDDKERNEKRNELLKLQSVMEATATAVYLVRDMINTPAEDCGPERMEEYVKSVLNDVTTTHMYSYIKPICIYGLSFFYFFLDFFVNVVLFQPFFFFFNSECLISGC